jgi:hypothetical protein
LTGFYEYKITYRLPRVIPKARKAMPKANESVL